MNSPCPEADMAFVQRAVIDNFMAWYVYFSVYVVGGVGGFGWFIMGPWLGV